MASSPFMGSSTRDSICTPSFKVKVMNKTLKTILQVLSYIIAALLGAGGAECLL